MGGTPCCPPALVPGAAAGQGRENLPLAPPWAPRRVRQASAQHLSSLCSAPSSEGVPLPEGGRGRPRHHPCPRPHPVSTVDSAMPTKQSVSHGEAGICGAGDPRPTRGWATVAAEACRQCLCRPGSQPPPVASLGLTGLLRSPRAPTSFCSRSIQRVAEWTRRWGWPFLLGKVWSQGPGAAAALGLGAAPLPRPWHGVSGQSAATSSPGLLVGGGVASSPPGLLGLPGSWRPVGVMTSGLGLLWWAGAGGCPSPSRSFLWGRWGLSLASG